MKQIITVCEQVLVKVTMKSVWFLPLKWRVYYFVIILTPLHRTPFLARRRLRVRLFFLLLTVMKRKFSTKIIGCLLCSRGKETNFTMHYGLSVLVVQNASLLSIRWHEVKRNTLRILTASRWWLVGKLVVGLSSGKEYW